MRARRFLTGSMAAVLTLVTASAGAQGAPDDVKGAWMLGLGAQLDEDDSDSVLASLNVGVGASTWLTFAAGRSSSPADRANIEADTVLVGVDHRFNTVGFTLEAEQWGDKGALETSDLAGSIYLDRGSLRIGFGYETRDIEIPFTLTGPFGGTLRRTVDVGAERYSIDARVAVGERWQLFFAIAEHDYERNLNVLPRIDSLNLLSTSTLTLANSFIDHERSVAAERALGPASLNVRFATDRSAIDNSKFETLEAAVLVPLGRRFDLEVNLGRGRSQFFGGGLYGGLLLLVYSR